MTTRNPETPPFGVTKPCRYLDLNYILTQLVQAGFLKHQQYQWFWMVFGTRPWVFITASQEDVAIKFEVEIFGVFDQQSGEEEETMVESMGTHVSSHV